MVNLKTSGYIWSAMGRWKGSWLDEIEKVKCENKKRQKDEKKEENDYVSVKY